MTYAVTVAEAARRHSSPSHPKQVAQSMDAEVARRSADCVSVSNIPIQVRYKQIRYSSDQK